MPNFKNILSQIRFSAEKMQKVNLFETKNFFCDVYCLEPGQEQKPHAHRGADKFYFVLEGAGTIRIGAEECRVAKHDICLAAAGLEHGVKNTSAERLILLVFMAPNPNTPLSPPFQGGI
jgi:mannose-6-phosphate isomerase-like protein (cupin superfamily)